MTYTVYGLPVSNLGDPVEQSDINKMQALLDEELEKAGLGERAAISVTEEAGRYSFIPDWDEDLRAVVDRAFERFIANN